MRSGDTAHQPFTDGMLNIGLVHSFDIRGNKVGGLETYLRDFVTFCPPDARILFVGVDAIGDLPLGKITEVRFRGRTFDFLPIMRYSDEKAREAARKITDSITACFAAALVRYLPTVRRAFRERNCSLDLRRVEFAWLPVLLGLPYVQMLHGEGVPRLAMDSLLQKYRMVHLLGERFAVRTSRKFLCVNPMITERIRKTYPRHAGNIDTLWTWVNTAIYKPRPFPAATDPFRIAFIGRLDEFKQPGLMFRTIARLRQLLPGGVELHYVGTSHPERYPEFEAIKDVVIQHGFKDAHGIADLLGSVHAGILTSEFEGMPRCVLETLAVGRPVVAVHLPQLEAVIHDGESGYLVPREQPQDQIVEAMAQRFCEVHEAIATGAVDPAAVAEKIGAFTPQTQLARVYGIHRDIQFPDVPGPLSQLPSNQGAIHEGPAAHQ